MNYPSKEYKNVAEKVVEVFSKDNLVKSILLTGSCAFGKAKVGSDIDFYILIKNLKEHKKIELKFEALKKSAKEFKALSKEGVFADADLHISTGVIVPKERGWTSGPNDFELEIGNIFAYSVVLFDRNNYFTNLKKKYLPYYSEKLRKKKLAEARKFCINNLDHIKIYSERGLYFQCFDRLYKAMQEFLQALFIKHKKYPIAYDKWIKYQLCDILKAPLIYKELVDILQIKQLEGKEISQKAEMLRNMVRRYL